jgi:ribosome maturation factor RimP
MDTDIIKGIIPEIEKLFLPFLEKQGVELVELNMSGMGRTTVFRAIVWASDGMRLDRISSIARHLGDILDENDIIPMKYTLEVSSPGLDRQLTTTADFRRVLGEKVRVILKDGKEAMGTLLSVAETGIVLQNETEQMKIPINQIVKGKILIEF